MDVHLRLPDSSNEKWEAFHLSTLVFCVLGVLGNVSSLVVLVRHLDEIAGSRLLLALAVADLGVVSSIAFRTLSYVTYGNSQLTRVLAWWFTYWYYCSIYLTLFVFLDRYFKTAKWMLLLKINYPKIVRRTILAVFGVMLVVSLPHLLGACVRYFDGLHLITIRSCPCDRNLSSCDVSSSVWEIRMCNDTLSSDRSYSYSELGEQQTFVDAVCNISGSCSLGCGYGFVSIPVDKFKPTYFVRVDYDARQAGQLEKNSLRVCPLDTKYMRSDPTFVKAVYLGIDLPFRYAIPCCFLLFLSIRLVNAVYKARKRNRALTRKAFKSLLNLPAFWNTVCIVFVFLVCHTGGLGLFAKDIFFMFTFATEAGDWFPGTQAFFSRSQLPIMWEELESVAFLLPAINSSVNIILYAFFLPVFRKEWLSLFIPGLARISSCSLRGKTLDAKDIIPMEEIGETNIEKKLHAPIQQSQPDRRTTGKAQRCRSRFNLTRIAIRLLVLAVGFGFLFLLIVTSHRMHGHDDIDYSDLKPVRYAKFNHSMSGLCVCEPWMIVSDYIGNACRVYRLADLRLMDQLSVAYSHSPRAERNGLIFVPGYRNNVNITLLGINGTGKMTVLRNLTAGGRDLRYPSVATGLEADLLCVSTDFPPALLIVNVTEDRVVREMELPKPCQTLCSVAALASGEVLIYYSAADYYDGSLALYGSVSEPPTLLTNMTSECDVVLGLLGTGNRFLVPYCYSSELLVVAPDGSVLHVIEALTGKLGIWLYRVSDVAVWQDCVWVGGGYGDLVLLC